MVAYLLSPNRLNVTEVLLSDFKNAFPGIFNFTAAILATRDIRLAVLPVSII